MRSRSGGMVTVMRLSLKNRSWRNVLNSTAFASGVLESAMMRQLRAIGVEPPSRKYSFASTT